MDESELPVVTPIPRGADLVAINDRYGPLPVKISCGIQTCRTAHQRGFVVAYVADGQEGTGIIGRICGQNRFGATWMAAERAYDVKMRAAEMAVAKDRFLSRSNKVLPELDALVPRLRLLNDAWKAIRADSPWLVQLCLEAARTCRYVMGFTNEAGVTVQRHKLEGARFWQEGSVPLVPAVRLQAEARRYLTALSDPDVKNKDLEQQLNGLKDLEHRWATISKSAQHAEAALRPGHLRALFMAAEVETPMCLQMRGGALYKNDLVGKIWRWVHVCDLG